MRIVQGQSYDGHLVGSNQLLLHVRKNVRKVYGSQNDKDIVDIGVSYNGELVDKDTLNMGVGCVIDLLRRGVKETCDLPIGRDEERVIEYTLLFKVLFRRRREKGDEGEKGARPWMEKREKPCTGWRKHERRALVGTDGTRALEKGLSPRLEWKDDERR
ncbi:hypothetical protein TNCV_3961301 [Trichonephila clavipes]|nr:hypothetical protein TNCV_3961301 [Trichonephila clavipes]